MSTAAITKSNLPSKVHHSEYIVTENGPQESRPRKQPNATKGRQPIRGRPSIMNTITRILHV